MSSPHTFLNKHTARLYHIKYHNNGRANHYAHGVIALYRLGATPERILQFTDGYLKILDDAKMYHLTEQEKATLTVEDLKGQEIGYHVLLDHFENKLKVTYKGDRDAFIRSEFNRLREGLSSEAFHGLIHMGYGYSVENDEVIIEGISFMYHDFLPLVLTDETRLSQAEWTGTESLIDLLAEAASDQTMMEDMRTNQAVPGKKGGGYTLKVGTLLWKYGDKLLNLVMRAKVPGTDPKILRNFIVDSAITVYIASEAVNEFFLLHGVTSAWSLRELLPLFDQPDSYAMIRTYMCCLIACYLFREAPGLSLDKLAKPGSITRTWDDIIAETLDGDKECHKLKLAQCCYDMSKECPGDDTLYKQAAIIAISNPYAFAGRK